MSVSAGTRPAVWSLADSGWEDVVMIRLTEFTQERNRKLNTLKSDNIDELFIDATGLPVMSDSWHWKAMSSTRPIHDGRAVPVRQEGFRRFVTNTFIRVGPGRNEDRRGPGAQGCWEMEKCHPTLARTVRTGLPGKRWHGSAVDSAPFAFPAQLS
jgi:hypothetical protein